ncbi:tRNA (guanosine(46)-N7)-methyltransferase TrmB [Pseudomaricurvus alcaniphilus]|uniref:tRNA (guanosine(46)-N7)-methyltransferase TrmB n=1 Tax=Pseudomaricurvus alcaniphilus TaxID=1166482 RepID=UPI001408C61F|nr:tRNA (guanosine(46)-N7)-methyltransferase TrmB [Pseudomaricurvus alcaniphilus]NHN38769.1 tRNA (guanosine(46)-N7)-methyltransferase TrmB [Pseudomaricurvus alcaniphilus]
MNDTLDFKPEFKKKAIRSYVIRGGRITAAQKKAFDLYWPDYGLSLFDGPLDIATCFGREAPVVLEIGFGMGDSLLHMARNEPEKDFIGIEVHPPGVGCLINNAGKEGLRNLRIYMADALDVLHDCIADASLDRFQLYFPDPWHKKKHNKRRIVQLPFIAALHNKLKPSGIIHMATDWEAYAEHMMEVLTLSPGLVNVAGEYLFAPRPDYRPITKFEKRGEKLGHGVWDLVFQVQR